MEVAVNVYDDTSFFSSYASLERSGGLELAGEWPTLGPLLEGIHGGRVLDLGCGYGWHADFFSRRGCKVTALDSSHSMLEEARRRFPAIDFRCQDILDYDYPEDEYDLVFSNLAFHYIEDLGSLFRKIHRTLRKGGRLVFNIEHPTFTAGVRQEAREDDEGIFWPVRGYFRLGARRTVFLGHEVVKQHHTMEELVMGPIGLGFRLEELREVRPTAQWLAEHPGQEVELERPMMLILSFRKE